ncbi:MAG TPA: Dabb family protein [Albitalea sp.]|nr:Dabb family protein [Albitalea sp.]
MIRHIVMWRVRGDTPAERRANARVVQQAFEAMRGRVPGLRRVEIGLDISGVDYACDMVLVTDFDDAESLAAYATHPEHLRAKQTAGDLRIARHQVDYLPDP